MTSPRLAFLLAVAAGPAVALSLDFPTNARRAAEQDTAMGSYRLPISGFTNGAVETIWAEGEIRQQAWHITTAGATTLQVLAPLRKQLIAEGFDVLFECEARDCGGFDFRYAMEVMPEPDMHVDLGDYRFIALQRMGETRPEYVSLLVSRSVSQSYVQVTRIGPPLPRDGLVVTSTKNPALPETAAVQSASLAVEQGNLIPALEGIGRAVLNDLDFEIGSSSLANSGYASLQELAAYLKADPTRAIVLVGHTDAEGSLAGNIALSKKRASSVRAQLVGELGVPAGQVGAEGVGYLSPLASNLTEEGRTRNRRVEVILSVTE